MKKLVGYLGLLAGTVASTSTASAQSYNLNVTTGTLVSIAGTGTPLSFSSTDDDVASITPGFSFNFFGVTIPSTTTVYVSTNGMINIDGSSTYSNTSIPVSGSPDGFVAAFWDDLDITGGNVYYQVQGSSGSYVLVVEWNNIVHLSTSDTFTFQARMYQATGNIELFYGSRLHTGGWDGSIGVESQSGTVGVSASCTPSCTPDSVPSGTKLVFTPGAGPPPSSDLNVPYVDSAPPTVTAGQQVTLSWEVDNIGTNPSAPTTIGLYAGLSPTVTAFDTLLTSNNVGEILNGSYEIGTFSFTVPNLSGSYYVAAIVDPQGLVNETNETNNSYSLGSVTIGGGGGDTITVTTNSLPEATVGQHYNFQLQQSGGTAPTWSVISGTLPAGITLSSGGLLSGTPSTPQNVSFTVEAYQSGYTPGSANLSLRVNDTSGGVRIDTTSLPTASVGVPYSATIMASGGVTPYAFTVLQGPAWLIPSSSGMLSGTPTETGEYTLLVYVVDSAQGSTSAMLPLLVSQPTELMLMTSPPAAVVNMPYAASIVTGGRPTYMLEVTSGMLPAGLNFDSATGMLNGTPTAAGSWDIGVRVTDSSSPPATVTGMVRVSATELMTLRITVGNEVSVYTNSDINFELTAAGGVPPYTWSMVRGVFQEGLSLDTSSGHIVGRVMRVGSSTVTFGVSDSMGNRAEKEVIVRATVFRPGNNNNGGRGGGGSRDGCSCAATETRSGMDGLGLALAAFAVALALVSRRKR